MTKILNFLLFFILTYLDDAMSFTTLWMMCLSSYSLSAGVISMCRLLLIMVYSIVLLGLSILKDLTSSVNVRDDTP